jgi:hypothetical protein
MTLLFVFLQLIFDSDKFIETKILQIGFLILDFAMITYFFVFELLKARLA